VLVEGRATQCICERLQNPLPVDSHTASVTIRTRTEADLACGCHNCSSMTAVALSNQVVPQSITGPWN
jgi:hypothetical protein